METEITEVKTNINESIKMMHIVYFIICMILIITTCIVAYKIGCQDTKRLYEEPQIHVTLVPELGTVTVIPLKLTAKGVGIKFNLPITNLIAIGIDMPNVKK